MSSTYDYSFPFRAYPQQQQLMEAITECISLSAVGCFESPTGTGKSLSIICAALTWLVTEEGKKIKLIENDTKNKEKESSSSDDWLTQILSADSSGQIGVKQKAVEKYKSMKKRLSTVLDNRYNQIPINVARVNTISKKDLDDEADAGIDEFILPNYDSSDEKVQLLKRKAGTTDLSGTSGSDDDVNIGENDGTERNADSLHETLDIPQIYYCSRTHSQISQFVSEIKKTKFKEIRCVTLGSRRSLCANNAVRKLSSDVAMSEKCLDMQKKKKGDSCKKVKSATGSSKGGEANDSRTGKCKYHEKRFEKQLADFSLSRVRDIEEVVHMGEDLHACPYYASREAVGFAQLVCAPYNIILQADMRHSMGLRLKGNVLIFDEAHNLIDTVSQLHSAELSVRQLQQVCDAVAAYLERFQTLLNGRNLYYVNLLHSVVKRLASFMRVVQPTVTSSVASAGEVVMGVNDFLFQAALDNINLFKLKKHILGVNLANRMGGYADSTLSTRRVEEGDPSAVNVSPEISSIYTHAIRSVLDMLHCLTTAEADGVLVVHRSGSNDGLDSTMKYVMLNPGSYFKAITAEARSVLLVGGTLQPFSYLQDMLFPHIPRSGLRFFSCGHIVPPSHVCGLIVGTGPISGSKIEVTFEHRLSPLLLQELHRTVLDVCTIVPHGVVLFFTSYAYMDSVLAYWRENRLLSALEQVKHVFAESRGRSSDGEDVWKKYSAMATKSRKGALLCSVMGGKLSEGINFSDDLARCVMVVGLPYPDKRDVVFKEKLKYADSLQVRHSKEVEVSEKSYPSEKFFLPKREGTLNSRVGGDGGSSSSSSGTDGRKASTRLYDAVCMRALNQSIGRSVRHAKDYAAIILVDDRFRQPHIIAQLPSWIGNRVQQFSDFNKTKQHLTSFFQEKSPAAN